MQNARHTQRSNADSVAKSFLAARPGVRGTVMLGGAHSNGQGRKNKESTRRLDRGGSGSATTQGRYVSRTLLLVPAWCSAKDGQALEWVICTERGSFEDLRSKMEQW